MRSPRLVSITLAVVLICLCLSQIRTPSALATPVLSIRVAPSGNDEPQCGSEAFPCRTIQYAVDLSSPGDRVLVAEGVYTFDPSYSDCEARVGAAAVVCARDPEFTLVGGYSTSNWTSPDPSTQVTVIDGQNAYRGVFFVSTGPTTDFTMEGFTIRNGLARGIHSRPGTDGFFAYGGGMWVDLGYPTVPTKKIVLRNLIFKDNKALGEDHAPYGGSGIGGGLALRSVASATLEYVTFEGNEARGGSGSERGGYGVGGGFHSVDSNAALSHSTFTNNIARGGNSSGSGWYGSSLADGLGGGAGVHLSNLTLDHATVKGNQAIGGSAVDQAGCGAAGGLFGEGSTLTVLDSEISLNRAEGGNAHNGGLAGGGGIDAYNSNLLVRRTHVTGNLSKGGMSTTGTGNSGQPGGGGLYVVRFEGNAIVEIENSVIADNSLEFGATGSTGVGGGGGGIWLQGAEAYITHTTIARNHLAGKPQVGNAILLLGFVTPTPATAEIEYSIIADHTGDCGVSALYVIGGNAASLKRTLWAGNHKDTNIDTWEHPDIDDQDPIHAPSAGFVSPGPPDYDYHIRGDSPARDQAAGSLMPEDIDGDARLTLGVLDIGADEYVPPSLRLTGPWRGDETLRVSWEPDQVVAEAVDHYDLVVSCEQGASPPSEGPCGSPINVGLETSYTLTGLTNGKTYTIAVEARDSSSTLIASSNSVSGIPRVFDFSVHLPLVFRSQ
jgi:hypothetical protein